MPPQEPIDIPIAAALPLQQSQLLVSAVDGHRLRDRTAPHHRPERFRRRRDRRARSGRRDAHRRRRPSRARGARRSCSMPHSRRATWRCVISRFDPVDTVADARRRPECRAPRPEQPAPARPGPRAWRRRPRRSSRSTRRWSATRRTRASRSRDRESDRPGGHSPPYFALLNQVVAGIAVRLAQRSGELRELSDVLPRARSRAPVVGTGGRLEELSRAVAQRGVRAVFRGAVCREGSRSRACCRTCFARCGARRSTRRRRARSTSATASATSRADERIFRAIVYNKARDGAAHAAPARRRRGVLCRACATFYTDWKFKKAGTDDFRAAMEKACGRDLQRFFDTLDLRHRRSRT